MVRAEASVLHPGPRSVERAIPGPTGFGPVTPGSIDGDTLVDVEDHPGHRGETTRVGQPKTGLESTRPKACGISRGVARRRAVAATAEGVRRALSLGRERR
jgi:hypothetical protein